MSEYLTQPVHAIDFYVCSLIFAFALFVKIDQIWEDIRIRLASIVRLLDNHRSSDLDD